MILVHTVKKVRLARAISTNCKLNSLNEYRKNLIYCPLAEEDNTIDKNLKEIENYVMQIKI